jgi:hypothetical protein
LRSVAAEMKLRLRLKLGSPSPDRSLFSPSVDAAAAAQAAVAEEDASESDGIVDEESTVVIDSLERSLSATEPPSDDSFLVGLGFAVLRLFFFCRASRMTELCSGSTFWT